MSPCDAIQPVGHTAYHHVGHTAYHHVGADEPATESGFWQVFRLGVIGLAAYHGYRRYGSVGWAIGWALVAGISPPVTIGIAVAQGLGKRKGA